MCGKIKRQLYATVCECEIRSNQILDGRSVAAFWLPNVQKMTIKTWKNYQTAHQNDRFNALRLHKLNPACFCYDSKPAKLHKARWRMSDSTSQLSSRAATEIGQVRVVFKSDQAQ